MRNPKNDSDILTGEEPLTKRPFKELKAMLQQKQKEIAEQRQKEKLNAQQTQNRPKNKEIEEDELAIFYQAMAGVKPLEERPEPAEPKAAQRPKNDIQDKEALLKLKQLIEGKTPLDVSSTPEYVWGAQTKEAKLLAKRLKKGDFAIQAYCDLHGMTVEVALEACDDFMADALRNRYRCIAFIHGRGLSSPKEPVLKGMVTKWLNQGPYRRFVMAYSSAPAWDGGAGVTYVLLNKRPFKRKKKKGGFWF